MNEADQAIQAIRDANDGHMFSYPGHMLKLERDQYREELQKKHPWRNLIGIRWIGESTVKEPGDSFSFHSEEAE